jgi:hypothetical protein
MHTMACMQQQERALIFMRERVGAAYCAACLGRELALSPLEAENAIWALQQSRAFVMRSGQCSSCLRHKRVVSASPEKAVLAPEAAVIALLLERPGEEFCDACLAFGSDVSLEEARRGIVYIHPLPEFTRRNGECSVCGRAKTVVSAVPQPYPEGAERPDLAQMPTGTVHYRGWRIDILSYRMRGGWRPFVAIQSPTRLVVPSSPSAFREAFASRAEADQSALDRATEWIDKRY